MTILITILLLVFFWRLWLALALMGFGLLVLAIFILTLGLILL